MLEEAIPVALLAGLFVVAIVALTPTYAHAQSRNPRSLLVQDIRIPGIPNLPNPPFGYGGGPRVPDLPSNVPPRIVLRLNGIFERILAFLGGLF